MKNGNPHRVPLSSWALAILGKAGTRGVGTLVFQKPGLNEPLSNMALLAVLRRINRSDLTAHGFRSTFRDWVADRTNYPAEVAEMALAHTVSDKVLAAYRRTDLFDRRKQLMDDWGWFCGAPKPSEAVASLRAL
jgi:integrase